MALSDFQKNSINTSLSMLENTTKIKDLVEVGRHITRMESMGQSWFVDAVNGEFRKRVDYFVPKKKKFLIIDTSMIFCECWFATKGVDSANSAMITTNSIISSHDGVIPIMTLDKGETWRHRRFPGYKGDRNEKPHGFAEARQEFEDLIDTFGIAKVHHPDYESDDCMATLSETASKLGHRSILVTRDTDAWQLLSDKVVMWHRRDGWRTVESTKEVDGLEPSQVVDYLCMVGKDCVPKPAGIGPKNALKFLHAHGSIHNAIANLCGNTTMEKSLIDFFHSDYMLAREMHTMNRTLDIKWRW